MSWTDERVEQLRAMWSEGMSASQIAKQLGGVTRNAVIGKVHRLGLSNRSPSGKPVEEAPKPAEKPAAKPAARSRAEKPAPEAPVQAAPEPAAEAPKPEEKPLPQRVAPQIRDASEPRAPGLPTPEEEEARLQLAEIEKLAKRIDLMELTERTCKWPIGDPNDEDFHFCGLASVPGKPYCEYHVAVAFQPMSNRRDRARPSR